MSNILSNLEPQKVFYFFEEISKIPRGSGNEKAISDYIYKFAKDKGFDVVQDKALNIIIKKKATKGYENSQTIILQAHMDMVCEKNSDVQHDFTKDSLKLRIEENYIKATGTTLGADDGIGVAYLLAILDSDDLNHPNLEVVITTDEEQGMTGANAIDASMLDGKIIINLDSELEGQFFVSCAGGSRVYIHIPCEFVTKNENYLEYSIKINGLLGGHSGIDIHLNRGNANIITGYLLNLLSKELDFNIVNINGGAQFNAIPRECEVIISVHKDNAVKLNNVVKSFKNTIRNEYKDTEPHLDIHVNETKIKNNKVLSEDITNKICEFLMICPNGVQSMSPDIEELVESSLNIGVLSKFEKYIEANILVRSNKKSKTFSILEKLETVSKLIGAKFEVVSSYPELEFKKDSKITELCQNVYTKMYSKDPIIAAVHAGLEGGIFSEKIKGVDFISFGPTMHNIHSPKEELSISSTKRVWEFLIKILEETKNI